MFSLAFVHQIRVGDIVSIPDIIFDHQNFPAAIRSIRPCDPGLIELVYEVEGRSIVRLLPPWQKIYRAGTGNENLLRIGDVVTYVTMLTNRWQIRGFSEPGMVETVPKTRLRESTWPYKNGYLFAIKSLILPQGILIRKATMAPEPLPACTQLSLFSAPVEPDMLWLPKTTQCKKGVMPAGITENDD